MQTTNTTYSPSDTLEIIQPAREQENGRDCRLTREEQQPSDSLVYVPLKSYTPVIQYNKSESLTESLIYTVVFLSIFAIIRMRGKGLLPLLASVIWKRKKTEIVLTEGITPNLLHYILALFLSFSALSAGIIYIATGELNWQPILLIFAILTVYHLLLLFIIRLAAWTFNARAIGEEAIVHLWTYNIMAGILVSPFIIAIFFVKAFAVSLLVKITIICLGLFYLVKLLRWIEILLVHRVSIFYMILYLCALEVIPLLLVYKILV